MLIISKITPSLSTAITSDNCCPSSCPNCCSNCPRLLIENIIIVRPIEHLILSQIVLLPFEDNRLPNVFNSLKPLKYPPIIDIAVTAPVTTAPPPVKKF